MERGAGRGERKESGERREAREETVRAIVCVCVGERRGAREQAG